MKGTLLVEESDIPKVAALLETQWREELERNGLFLPEIKDAQDGEGVTCPACGTTAPLDGNACSDCGLVIG